MNTYILLRNNKESRPLSCEDLQQMDLKQTDLIWIECQSVCWQHPQEIKELRAMVTEVGNNNPGNPAISIHAQPIQADPPKLTEVKPIVENLILETPLNKKEYTSNSPGATNETDLYKYGGVSESMTPGIEKESADMKINYSRPLDEIKEMYIKKMQEKGNRQAQVLKIRIPNQYKKAALYAALVAAGALIMLLIRNNGNNTLPVTRQNNGDLNQDKSLTDAKLTDPVKYEKGNEIQDTIAVEEVSLPQVEEKKSTDFTKKTLTTEKPGEIIVNKDIDNGMVEKSKHPVNEVPVPKKVRPDDLSALVSVKANDYGIGSFGGIRNLKMTLQNDSKYVLDMVTVELKYLNPEGIILKTENIHFKSVQPGTQEKVAVNKSKRGVKIAYTIIKIESKETTAATAGL